MSQRQFLEAATKRRVTEIVRAIEAETSVEVVVCVQKGAAKYRAALWRAGAVAGLLVFAVMMLSPTYYAWWVIGTDSVLAALLGAAACANWPLLKRALTKRSELEFAVQSAADTAFERLGVTNTRERTGLLVFVGLFERHCIVKADTGVATELLGPGFETTLAALSRATSTLDETTFLDALGGLARPLADVHPRRPDDINELADDLA